MGYPGNLAEYFVGKLPLAALSAVGASFLGCVLVAFILHEPVPLVHDEFSYLLMSDTFVHGHVANPSPPLSEFFDTFHVLVRPVYASKYFPMQGTFLAIGERLTGHPAVGIWLSSALACAAATWMLQAWLGNAWGLLGGFLMVVQYGIFSYWSQSYWGGMVAALGGALFFGAVRRLWDEFTWQSSIWLALGLLILMNSRPFEGLLAVLPASGLFLWHLWRNRRARGKDFWLKFALPCLTVLAAGLIATGAYNRAITGSAFTTPYMLHEHQYQQSPPLIFLPQRPKITYSSLWVQNYYEMRELAAYQYERAPGNWFLVAGGKIATWWDFYCGILLSVPIFVPSLLRKGKTRICQILFLIGLLAVPVVSIRFPLGWTILVDGLAVLEVFVVWKVFADFWSHLAVATGVLIMTALLFAKWSFPHYFAPAACLVLYLQVEGLRQIWAWNPQAAQADRPLTRTERRRLARASGPSRQKPAFNLRWVVYALPIACVIALVLRVEGRLNGWKEDPHGLVRQALRMDDWSLDRANMEKWLEQQPTPQLVFVRYSPYHNINSEWVYNHADIMHSHVIWARDLGAEHNKLLLNLLKDRTVWLVLADRRGPQLLPYAEVGNSASPPQAPTRTEDRNTEQD